MISQKNNFVTYRDKFPSLLVKKLIVFSSKYISLQIKYFLLKTYLFKPVKNACNSKMLRTKPSPLEKTLNKNSPRPSNESSIFSSKIDLDTFYQPKSPSYQVWSPYALWTWTFVSKLSCYLICTQRVMWPVRYGILKRWANEVCWTMFLVSGNKMKKFLESWVWLDQDIILGRREWLGKYFGWMWVVGGVWGITLGGSGLLTKYFGWVAVRVGEWGIIFGGLEVGGKSFWVGGGGWGWVRVRALFDNAQLLIS